VQPRKSTIQCYTTIKIKGMAENLARREGRTMSNLVEQLIVDRYESLQAKTQPKPKRNLLGD